jgi:hypothetical protein
LERAQIRIRTKNGNISKVTAVITTLSLDGEYRQLAWIGSVSYEIIDRDEDGPIYGLKS